MMPALWVLLGLFFGWPLLLLVVVPRGPAGQPQMTLGPRVFYTLVQLVSWWATFVGWFLLIYPCARQLWVVDASSIADALEPRTNKISRWSWEWLNPVYGNPQEGVSGQEAIIRDAQGNQIPYMPGASAWWRAYCWAAWRNSADGLKYLFEWDLGPLVTFTFFGRSVRAGWLPMPQIRGAPHVPVFG